MIGSRDRKPRPKIGDKGGARWPEFPCSGGISQTKPTSDGPSEGD
jgi:hypothetical protein